MHGSAAFTNDLRQNCMGFLRKLTKRHAWRRIYYERLTEPLHLNALSLLVGVFGSFRLKVEYDLVIRHYNAYGILKAADHAKALNLPGVTVVEFGVAAGAGLVNMCLIAEKVSRITGVAIKVVGFDTGTGMPGPYDFRDHPDLYREGDFPSDLGALRRILPANGHLVLGELSKTVPTFLKEQLTEQSPLGYAVVDVDYYSSTVDALKLFGGHSSAYLPTVSVYLDDIHFEVHNPYAGELLAVREFNERTKFRKICRHEFLECSRLFRRAEWIKHMFILQVMDHPARQAAYKGPQSLLENPYL
jgi:hypothetical protein